MQWSGPLLEGDNVNVVIFERFGPNKRGVCMFTTL